ncbi:MAG TPA: hypothetical protein VGV13_13260 [Methylomirabilota bacterium]|jgi:hypothetical protein|nr:hypothetical protein [Methylomirabilota bacterium]
MVSEPVIVGPYVEPGFYWAKNRRLAHGWTVVEFGVRALEDGGNASGSYVIFLGSDDDRGLDNFYLDGWEFGSMILPPETTP